MVQPRLSFINSRGDASASLPLWPVNPQPRFSRCVSQQSPRPKDSLTASESSHQRAERNQYFQRVSHISSFGVRQLRNGTKSALCIFFLHLIARGTNESSARLRYTKCDTADAVEVSQHVDGCVVKYRTGRNGELCHENHHRAGGWLCYRLCLNHLIHQDAPLCSSTFSVSHRTVSRCKFLRAYFLQSPGVTASSPWLLHNTRDIQELDVSWILFKGRRASWQATESSHLPLSPSSQLPLGVDCKSFNPLKASFNKLQKLPTHTFLNALQ